jgi:hypothetical protein
VNAHYENEFKFCKEPEVSLMGVTVHQVQRKLQKSLDEPLEGPRFRSNNAQCAQRPHKVEEGFKIQKNKA